MAKTDLSGYNLSELKGLQFEVEKEIKERQRQEVKEARERILAIAQDLGVPVEQLIAGAPGKPKAGAGGGKKVQAQFRNPDDETQTWTGRGRQPKWVAEALAGGKSLDDLRI